MKFPWLIDPKDQLPSVTLTAFVYGFLTAIVKLALSGMTVHSISFAQFSGVDFSAVVASLGGLYVLRRLPDPISKDTDKNA